MIEIIQNDARKALSGLADQGVLVDAVVTDPPYYLESTVKRFGKTNAKRAKDGSGGRFQRASQNFIGHSWDAADASGYRIAHDIEFWKSVFDVMKPGAFVLAFSSAKTGHWQAVAMESAGFRPHPFLGWVYATGMPKGHAVTKFVPSAVQWEGWHYGEATLRAAVEPIFMMQKPFQEKTGYANVLKHGVGAINMAATRNSIGNLAATILHDGSEAAELCLSGRGSSFNSFPVFYCGKASSLDRAGSLHPTVKPIALMQHCVRLVTRPGGIVLDPFAGSGTTGEAARREGMDAILIEREGQFVADIHRRFAVHRYLAHVGGKSYDPFLMSAANGGQ